MQQDIAPRVDHLQRHLDALKSPDDLRRDGDRSLADYVEAERRDLDGDAFAILDKEIQDRISTMARRCFSKKCRCRIRQYTEASLCC